jgi:hypothetical protein
LAGSGLVFCHCEFNTGRADPLCHREEHCDVAISSVRARWLGIAASLCSSQ